MTPRVDSHTRQLAALVSVASSARVAVAICTSSLTWCSPQGSPRREKNTAPARRAAVRARTFRFSHCHTKRLGGCAHLVCSASVCADWYATFH